MATIAQYIAAINHQRDLLAGSFGFPWYHCNRR